MRQAYEAFGRGDIPAVRAIFDPDIEWVGPQGYPYGGTYRGHDQVVGLFVKAAETLGLDWRVQPDQFMETEDGVIVLGRHTGKGPDGAPWEVPFAMVWTMEDGRATKSRQYGDSAVMLEALKAWVADSAPLASP